MRKVFVFAILFFGLPLVSHQAFLQQVSAQQTTQKTEPGKPSAQATSSDTPTREQVLELFDLLKVRQNMEVMMEGMKDTARTGAEDILRQKVEEPSEKQIAMTHKIFSDVFGELPIQEMMEAVIPVYQRHLTRSDIEALITFYSSRVGQKLLHEQSAMIRESVQAGSEIGRKRLDEIMLELDRRIAEMVKSDEKAAKKP
ncbi:MAG TPA: DUF2059 domain-containing protein [Candidatus Angelobacter sp.]|nr:DUF2059 domain-containing protein [Candidatus Angelobacter sp.]